MGYGSGDWVTLILFKTTNFDVSDPSLNKGSLSINYTIENCELIDHRRSDLF